jgi:hypothetical protein
MPVILSSPGSAEAVRGSTTAQLPASRGQRERYCHGLVPRTFRTHPGTRGATMEANE